MPLYEISFTHSGHKDREYVKLYDRSATSVRKRVKSFYRAMEPKNIKVRIIKKR